MALTINDVLALGKMSFTKSDIAALMGAQPGNPQTATPPVRQFAAEAVPSQMQATPAPASAVAHTPAISAELTRLQTLVDTVSDLSAKVSSLSVPSAGPVGNPPQETSIEDIILGAYQPKPPEGNTPDFSKGVTA